MTRELRIIRPPFELEYFSTPDNKGKIEIVLGDYVLTMTGDEMFKLKNLLHDVKVMLAEEGNQLENMNKKKEIKDDTQGIVR